MRGHFEWFVANRYLRARRKQAVISVITVISVAGVASGVMALVIALAINAGFRGTLQRNLLQATAHVSILEKEPGYGIENWKEITAKLHAMPHVVEATPSLYGTVLMAGPIVSIGAVLKGIDPATAPELLKNLKQGSISRLQDTTGLPGIVLGARLADNLNLTLDKVVTVIAPQGDMLPVGMRPSSTSFRVVGIYESGFYELDATWAYTSLQAAQAVLGLQDVVNSIELRLDDIYRAPELARTVESQISKDLAATHWMEQNKPVLSALQMEKIVTVITIGLIQLVAALNILIALVMMVMEKTKDIAILMSMGARLDQIRRIFMLQGILIGVVGSVIGLALGYTICYFANTYRWVRLDAEVYSLSFVPFEPRWIDGVWIAGMAIFVSFVATLYPARNAARVGPVESLRYE